MKSKKEDAGNGGEKILIRIRVRTDCRKEVIWQRSHDLWNISVKEPAENNRANDRLVQILRMEFPGRIVRIIKGHHRPSKIVQII